MAEVSTYTGTARQDGRFWFVEVDGVGATQARHLREVDDMAADLVASMTGADVDDVKVEISVVLPAKVQQHLDEAERLHQVESAARRDAARASRAAARELAASGLPVRDVGKALGISHQRAHQLISGD